MKKYWKNAFAIVRPPGHHSGFKNNINGFCIYNNVAIGVKYLQ
jgi:histone deacetylase 6